MFYFSVTLSIGLMIIAAVCLKSRFATKHFSRLPSGRYKILGYNIYGNRKYRLKLVNHKGKIVHAISDEVPEIPPVFIISLGEIVLPQNEE